MRYHISLDFPCSSASPLCITPSEPQGTEMRLRAKIIRISCITNLLLARKCPNPSYPALFPHWCIVPQDTWMPPCGSCPEQR